MLKLAVIQSPKTKGNIFYPLLYRDTIKVTPSYAPEVTPWILPPHLSHWLKNVNNPPWRPCAARLAWYPCPSFCLVCFCQFMAPKWAPVRCRLACFSPPSPWCRSFCDRWSVGRWIAGGAGRLFWPDLAATPWRWSPLPSSTSGGGLWPPGSSRVSPLPCSGSRSMPPRRIWPGKIAVPAPLAELARLPARVRLSGHSLAWPSSIGRSPLPAWMNSPASGWWCSFSLG